MDVGFGTVGLQERVQRRQNVGVPCSPKSRTDQLGRRKEQEAARVVGDAEMQDNLTV
jgi:hypothetical protein